MVRSLLLPLACLLIPVVLIPVVAMCYRRQLVYKTYSCEGARTLAAFQYFQKPTPLVALRFWRWGSGASSSYEDLLRSCGICGVSEADTLSGTAALALVQIIQIWKVGVALAAFQKLNQPYCAVAMRLVILITQTCKVLAMVQKLTPLVALWH